MATNLVSQIVFFVVLLSITESHLYKCPDIYQSACTAPKCSSKAADKRALHRCDEWPFWSGGWGSYGTEHESYTCINATDHYCLVWSTKETKFRSNSTGTCFCVEGDLNETVIVSANYCSFWICVELQVFTNCQEGYMTGEICEDALNKEYNECECIHPSSNGEYCQKWQCLEIKKNQILETANYECNVNVSDDDLNMSYCQHWYGDIESEYEFELLDCSCDTEHDSNNFCMKWRCVEKEMTKHYSSGDKYAYFHAIFWPLFCALILGGSCASGTNSAVVTVAVVVIVVCGVGVITGGVVFLMIWLMVFAGPMLLLACCAYLNHLDNK